MNFRLRDYVLYPHAIWRQHKWLSGTQYWPKERRRAWQQERLDRLLTHAVEQVPWYRETLAPYKAEIPGMIDRLDLSELPVLTKEIVRNHYAELHVDDVSRYRTATTETSGSTGTPTRFVVDAASNIHQFASVWRMLNWTGYRFGQRYADMTGYLPRNDDLAAYDWRTNCLHLSSFNFKKEHMPEYVRRLRRFRPALVKAYPSALFLFCRWLKELGITDYRPRAVLTCAESLLDHQRALFEEVLDCPVFDFYNQNERGAMVSTCDRGTYHIHEEYALTELVPTGQPGMGAIVATNFHNFAMPLIRYQTDDLAEMVAQDDPCACGRTYQHVGRIVGRVEDIVVTPDGRHVGRLDAAFKYSAGIRMSQVVQETPDEIEVRIVRGASFSPSDLETLERELRARLGNAIGIRYDYVDEILPGKNGKVKFMVSRMGASTTAPTGAAG
jgi:phenylacetate-CoA ligase